MIVKDEAAIICRCLRHALPLIDYALIVDTGSTDDTQIAVRAFLDANTLPGRVVEEPWRDFAYNRTFALAKLREESNIDYSLMIDADQIIEYDRTFDPQKFKQQLRYDLYDIRIISGSIEYFQPQLASNKIDISYRGIIHEFRECPARSTRDVAHGLIIREGDGNARSRNESKYHHDAQTIEHALKTETDPFLIARYKFYLAQSYRDAGEAKSALRYYLERASLGFWDEEVFFSLYAAAKMKERLKHEPDDIIETYLKAFNKLPRRVEALHGAAHYCSTVERYAQGYALAKRGLQIPLPTSGLFVERWIYDYGLLDVFAHLSFLTHRYADGVKACVRLLSEGRLPEDQRDRVRRNAHFGLENCNPPQLTDTAALKDNNTTTIAPSRPLEALDATNAVTASISRNGPCPCGSGKRYKHCHGRNSQAWFGPGDTEQSPSADG